MDELLFRLAEQWGAISGGPNKVVVQASVRHCFRALLGKKGKQQANHRVVSTPDALASGVLGMSTQSMPILSRLREERYSQCIASFGLVGPNPAGKWKFPSRAIAAREWKFPG